MLQFYLLLLYFHEHNEKKKKEKKKKHVLSQFRAKRALNLRSIQARMSTTGRVTVFVSFGRDVENEDEIAKYRKMCHVWTASSSRGLRAMKHARIYEVSFDTRAR